MKVRLLDYSFWEVVDEDFKKYYVYKNNNQDLVCSCNILNCEHIKSVLEYNKNKTMCNFDLHEYM